MRAPHSGAGEREVFPSVLGWRMILTVERGADHAWPEQEGSRFDRSRVPERLWEIPARPDPVTELPRSSQLPALEWAPRIGPRGVLPWFGMFAAFYRLCLLWPPHHQTRVLGRLPGSLGSRGGVDLGDQRLDRGR
jgi:hypothetical protein